MRRSRLFRTLRTRSTRWLPARNDVGELAAGADGRGDAAIVSGSLGAAAAAAFFVDDCRIVLDVRGRYTSRSDTATPEVDVGRDPPSAMAARDGVCTAFA
jgi:hypothetical protein